MKDNDPINLARVKYQLRRGMLELDALLHRFFAQEFSSLSEHEQKQFAQLLELEDPPLYQMLIGAMDSELPDQQLIINCIREYSTNIKD